jgi:hypothetical protein
VLWTPTILILDPSGAERFRIEGYLPSSEFTAQLGLGLGRVSFIRKDWTAAERRYGEVAEKRGGTFAVPEAIYWQGVAQYKRTNDHTVLAPLAERLQATGKNIWATKASVFLPEKAGKGKSAG